jgi:hypothetical protein
MDRKPGGAFEQGYCAGVVSGITYMGFMVQVVQQVISTHNTPPQAFVRQQLCLDVPDEVTTGQLVRVVVAYVEARPARMHERFDAARP